MQTEPKTRLALYILGTAIVMGLLADALLRNVAWGINLTLWIALLIGGLFFARKRGGGSLEFGSALLLAPMIIFGICFAWRDSQMLRGLDLGAIVLAAALVITRQSAPFWAPSLSRVAGSVFNLMAHCCAGFVHLISRDIDWTHQRGSAIATNARGAAGGVLIAIPILLVFTVLFVRADAGFEKLFNAVLHINVWTHLLPVAVGTWLAGSYLRGVLVPSVPSVVTVRNGFQLGSTEINVALGMINILFGIFVALQAKYLFGSAQMVEITPGLTFSSYARRGFFELVTVALLVLPILLAADQLHAIEKSKRAFRIQSFVLVAFVLFIMVSAMHRMRLYQLEYGLTELRFYTVAFMIMLAAIFALFSGTVLRGYRGLFPMGTVAIAFVSIVALHTVNPDQWIAKANVANARAGRTFDYNYLISLSADAVPALLANGDLIPLPEIISKYETRLGDQDDFRSWNYGRHQAAKAIREQSK